MARKLLELSRPERFARIAVFLIAAGLCAIFISVGAYIYFFHGHRIGGTEDWGAFGAFISGAAGTALSAFTLAALAFTLALQADELAESRELAMKQSKILEKQSTTMAQQAFDSVFFNLLERFSQVRDSVKVEYMVPGVTGIDVVIATGRSAFFRMGIEMIDVMGTGIYLDNRLPHIQQSYKLLYRKHESELGPYFRMLYHIFKFLHFAAHLTPRQKIDYADIARAQLSDVELCVIFYDGLTDLATKFKPLIEWYGILKHVNEGTLLHPSDKTNESLYERSAFQSLAEREAKAST